jgi:hypothetical protein
VYRTCGKEYTTSEEAENVNPWTDSTGNATCSSNIYLCTLLLVLVLLLLMLTLLAVVVVLMLTLLFLLLLLLLL